jgi:hypothetical protein
MIKSTIKFTVMSVAALAIATLPIQAADKPEKAEGKAKNEAAEQGGKSSHRAIPFKGKLAAKTDTSITVGERTFEVNAETKIQKDGKKATLADGEVGKEVAGQYREDDGKLVAKMIRFGPKAETKDSAKPEKAPKDGAKPEKAPAGEKAKKAEEPK